MENPALQSIHLLVQGKTDSALLYALVAALTANSRQQINLLLDHSVDADAISNIHIASAICAEVELRQAAKEKEGKSNV